jgi:hypothetical protein
MWTDYQEEGKSPSASFPWSWFVDGYPNFEENMFAAMTFSLRGAIVLKQMISCFSSWWPCIPCGSSHAQALVSGCEVLQCFCVSFFLPGAWKFLDDKKIMIRV